MGGVPHVEGGLNSELYAVPVKRRQPKDQKNNAILQNNTQEKPTDVDSTDSEDKDENLPPGWQKHEGRYRARERDFVVGSIFRQMR
jgi:amyloid beta (A4) precursor protein-binding family B protein 2 (Fe65-like)